MINRLLKLLQDYSISFSRLSVSENMHNITPSHLGFDIRDNTIQGIKIYFKAGNDLIKSRYGISTENYEECISFSEVLTGTEKRFRWGCRPPFEQPPYNYHKEMALLLLNEIGCMHLGDAIFSIADIIQSNTGSKRYPLVGYGAVHENRSCLRAIGSKLYYSFWQAQDWSSIYAKNDSDISLLALNSLKHNMFNQVFCDQVTEIAEIALNLNNLISMYAVNICADDVEEKIYFVTDEKMWLDSLSSIHKAIFHVELDPRLSKLFQDIATEGFRYEELAYSVKNNQSSIKAYFMI